ncbi:MAG TPA: hypothetical protein VM674_06180 [Candidatus Acidoferrum sp.]|nr:hypothetical protein [Candidatus Acidoferrum sp.]
MSEEPVVRVVYLVPADRAEREDFVLATEAAIRHVQRWYWEQMANRKTFRLSDPVVEVSHLPHEASWFVDHQLAAEQTQWFWQNVLHDGFEATGGRFHDPLNRWVFYIDAENQSDQAVGGNAGVALLPQHDLMGLVGQSVFPGERGVCRWVGGLGHELGHAFELPHPPGYEQFVFDRSGGSLMALGFRAYPQTFLNPEDIAKLNASPFFSEIEFNGPMPGCQDLLQLRR